MIISKVNSEILEKRDHICLCRLNLPTILISVSEHGPYFHILYLPNCLSIYLSVPVCVHSCTCACACVHKLTPVKAKV